LIHFYKRFKMAGLLSSLFSSLHLTSSVSSSLKLIGAVTQLPQVRFKHRSVHKRGANNPHRGMIKHLGKPMQEWWDWDGLGGYKYRHHHYPNNITLRNVNKRRIFKQFYFQRSKLNDIRKNDILPLDIQKIAHDEVEWMPMDSKHTRHTNRCVVTGRARGIIDEYRVSRFIFRHEADQNRISGTRRAFWLYNTHIDP